MNEADVDFACTICSKCCRDLRLPLTVDEAVDWLSRGGSVQLLCEAVPWLADPPPENLWAAHKLRRSFAGRSGDLPVRVVVILAATFTGPCPNLQPDNRCGIYEERPLVCRIYPAEINPFVEFDSRNKLCPPDAWATGSPALFRGGRLVDARTVELIERSREADANEAPVKAELCRVLGIDRAAIANEGFAVHSPNGGVLLEALRSVRAQASKDGPSARPSGASGEWRLVSNRRASVDALAAVGAVSELAGDHAHASFEYLGLSDPTA
ncbi:YkgJ family cysteine cluster protein [Trinickia dinghuensis]|uniref:YkgJ family cysteine cluster protein n=1 Tax=Trinickia dinghuensis TaxID=2291023 RepID=A0A3D8K1K8_9BURK|nr:YkgJ family cysteine cluster protein [Trinickia dinghuensis]RDU98774.1 YkgJ family cysteine cluster protein [Trinickia dinghuensis]